MRERENRGFAFSTSLPSLASARSGCVRTLTVLTLLVTEHCRAYRPAGGIRMSPRLALRLAADEANTPSHRLTDRCLAPQAIQKISRRSDVFWRAEMVLVRPASLALVFNSPSFLTLAPTKGLSIPLICFKPLADGVQLARTGCWVADSNDAASANRQSSSRCDALAVAQPFATQRRHDTCLRLSLLKIQLGGRRRFYWLGPCLRTAVPGSRAPRRRACRAS